MSKLLSSEVYSSYHIDDWSLALELSAYLCLPDRRAMHELDFTVQVRYSMDSPLLEHRHNALVAQIVD